MGDRVTTGATLFSGGELAGGEGRGGEAMNELVLFAGAGLGTLGTHHLLGWRAVGYVEMAEYPCKVLEARIRDGLLSPAPIFHMHTRDFIRLGYAKKYRGVAQVVTAGFPCQPFSNAGRQQAGDDERNGWPDTIRIIREVWPEWVFLENVTGLLAGSHGYFGTVLGELAQSGYDAVWRVLSAAEVGAPHKRDRVWIVAHAQEQHWAIKGQETYEPGWSGKTVANANSERQPQPQGTNSQEREWIGDGGQDVADSSIERCGPRWAESEGQPGQSGINGGGSPLAYANGKTWSAARPTGETIHEEVERSGRRGSVSQSGEWWAVEPGLDRVVNGCPARVDRLKTIGNGQVPGVVAEVWRILTGASQ